MEDADEAAGEFAQGGVVPSAAGALGVVEGAGAGIPLTAQVPRPADAGRPGRPPRPRPQHRALDPQVMVTLTGRPELKPVADEVARRLAIALAELTSGGTAR